MMNDSESGLRNRLLTQQYALSLILYVVFHVLKLHKRRNPPCMTCRFIQYTLNGLPVRFGSWCAHSALLNCTVHYNSQSLERDMVSLSLVVQFTSFIDISTTSNCLIKNIRLHSESGTSAIYPLLHLKLKRPIRQHFGSYGVQTYSQDFLFSLISAMDCHFLPVYLS